MLSVAPREPGSGRKESLEDAAGREPTIEYGLPAQGILRPAVELRARVLGTQILRELACAVRASSGSA